MTVSGDYYKDNLYVKFDKEIISAEGVWDVVIESAAQIDISNLLQKHLNGPEVELTSIDGAWLQGVDECLYCVHERYDDIQKSRSKSNKRYKDFYAAENFFPSPYLPEGSIVVIRRENIDYFVLSLDKASDEHKVEDDKPSALLAVAALIELLKKDKNNRTQESIINELQGIVPKGLSESNMKKMLPEANRLLREAMKR